MSNSAARSNFDEANRSSPGSASFDSGRSKRHKRACGDRFFAIPQPRTKADPLPNLRPRNLRGCGIFHQVVNGNAAVAAQPRFDVLQCNVNISNKSLLRQPAKRNLQQSFSLILDRLGGGRIWFGLFIYSSNTAFAIGTRPGCATQVPSWPASTSRSLSLADALHGLFVGLRVIANRNLRGHASHRVNAALVARVNQQFHVGTQEWLLHRDAPRSGSVNFGWFLNFLMKLKM